MCLPLGRIPPVVLVPLLLCSSASLASLISSSKLELCYKTDSTAGCQDRFVVAVSIDGDQHDSESITYWRNATAGADPVTLDRPIIIKVAKSAPQLRYPLRYLQNYNSAPYEALVYTSALGCEDGPTSTSPSCGRAFDDEGVAIPHSQGYCCRCSLCQIIGLCEADSRANSPCSLFSTGASASCLRFGELWYSSYEIGSAITFYEVSITIEELEGVDGANASFDTIRRVRLSVGPERLSAYDDDFGVSVRLVGDFAKFKEAPSFSAKRLLVPAFPLGHARVQAPAPDEWLLVDTSRFTDDGSECNKIGVSYIGFASQGERCRMPYGSCTGSQIEDLRAEDKKLIEAGRGARYALSSFGQFKYIPPGRPASRSHSVASAEAAQAVDALKLCNGSYTLPRCWDALARRCQRNRGQHSPRARRARPASDASRPHVSLAQPGVQATLLTFTFSAAKLRYTVHLARGIIVSARVARPFEANSFEGQLSITVMNNSSLRGLVADFTVAVAGCSRPDAVHPVLAQTRSLVPQTPVELLFDIYVYAVEGVTNMTCTVALLDARGHTCDTRTVVVTARAQSQDRGAQGGTRNRSSTIEHTSVMPAEDAGCSGCSVLNPICFILRSCIAAVLTQMGTLLLVAGVAYLLFRFRSRLISVFKCCCCCRSVAAGDADSPEPTARCSGETRRARESRCRRSRKRHGATANRVEACHEPFEANIDAPRRDRSLRAASIGSRSCSPSPRAALTCPHMVDVSDNNPQTMIPRGSIAVAPIPCISSRSSCSPGVCCHPQQSMSASITSFQRCSPYLHARAQSQESIVYDTAVLGMPVDASVTGQHCPALVAATPLATHLPGMDIIECRPRYPAEAVYE